MGNIKIYHIVPALSKTGGGIAEALLNLCKVQVEAGLNLFVFGGDSKYPDESLDINYKTWGFSSMRRLHNELRSYNEEEVILHVHGAWTFSFVYVAILILFFHKKIKFIYQAHGLLASGTTRDKSFFKKLIAWHVYQKFIFRKSKFIISTSQREISDFSWCEPDPNKIFEIPLGISEEFFVPIKNTNVRSTSLLFMSQIIPVKGLGFLLESIYTLKKQSGTLLNLDIYGYGAPSYLEELKSLVIYYGLGEQVRFLGSVKRNNRVQLFDRYTLFVLPSRSESFGLVVLEALSRGCKILTTVNTPWVSKEYNEYIDAVELNVDNLSQELKIYQQSLSDVCDEDNAIRQSFVNKKFNWKVINEQILEVYSK